MDRRIVSELSFKNYFVPLMPIVEEDLKANHDQSSESCAYFVEIPNRGFGNGGREGDN